MLLGGSASGGMQKNYKQNRDLGKTKKNLKERTQGYGIKNGKEPLEFKKMSSEAYAEHLEKLRQRKKQDQIRVAIALIVVILGGFAFIYFF